MPYLPRTRTDDEIGDVLNRCVENIAEGRSEYPGESYEEGVRTAICWLLVTGYTPDHPFDE